MNIFFLHIGNEIEVANLMVRSIKITNPNFNLIQVTDKVSPEIELVDECLRFDGNTKNIMKFRFEAFSKIDLDSKTSNIFIDEDMLIINKIEPDEIFNVYETTFCKRYFNTKSLVNIDFQNLNMTEYKNKTLLEAWPFMGCFIATKNQNLYSDMDKMYEQLDEKYKFWYGDQIVLKDYYKIFDQSINLVEEFKYANLDTNANSFQNIKIMHFKGNRKTNMKNFYLNYFKNI